MTFTLVFLALLMGAVVWWLVRQTINVTPWEAEATIAAADNAGVKANGEILAPSKLALGTFLAVVTSLFALFISAYFIRMEINDWRPMPEYNLLWVNTGILVAASIALQWTWGKAKFDQRSSLKIGLIISLLLSCAFIGGQWMVWQQLAANNYVLGSNPANSFFYTLTALHVLHLAGGMVALLRTMARAWSSSVTAEKLTLSMELCAVYWHFLLMVWLVLFALFSMT